MSEGPAEPVRSVTGTGIPVRGNDIDTDQIIPARFMKVVSFEGLGEFVFFDQRFDENDSPKDHPFNEERYYGASILVVNANFGCGSSREHAPQALMRWGIDAIIGESFAEIFAGNCFAMGIPTVTADPDTIASLQDRIETDPNTKFTVDVKNETVTGSEQVIEVDIDPAQKSALIEGVYDTTAVMRSNMDRVWEVAENVPYTD